MWVHNPDPFSGLPMFHHALPSPVAAAFKVAKRDGSFVSFELSRITRAVALAMYAVEHGEGDNPHRGDAIKRYGLTDERFAEAGQVAAAVLERLQNRPTLFASISIEEIQDLVEETLVARGELKVAHAYMSYRTAHAARRPVHHRYNGMQDYIAESRYCRVNPQLGRRETWEEAADRVRDMHQRKFYGALDAGVQFRALVERGEISPRIATIIGDFGTVRDEIDRAFEAVKAKEVLPSMRSLQFGGPAIENAHARMFNCAASVANRPEFFREFFYLLLAGCGVGFSVQSGHVTQLPVLAPRGDELELDVRHKIIVDSIEGWGDAIDALFQSYIDGTKVEFAFHKIRPRGAPLKTSGGRAPGHLPLRNALQRIDVVLAGAAGRQLRPIEVYDICMHMAQAVLAGGVRRSATICLFSADDEEMMNAKTGDWFSKTPHRSASNNSAVLVRGRATREQFDRLFHCQKEFGEPGFYFAENEDHVTNPCVEIGLNPFLDVDADTLEKLRTYGYPGEVQVGDRLTGFQMCNLSTTNGALATSPEAFYAMCRAAAVIGTLQASYTDMPYLGAVTRLLNEREALIGVSICGVLDNPEVLLDPEVLKTGAAVVKAVNAVMADVLGIERAARTTCVKPEGTSSLVLGAASGIHPHHARRYFRRVQAATNDPIYAYFKQINPHLCERSVYGEKGATDVITFPVEAPPTAVLRRDITSIQLLEHVSKVQEHWVREGKVNDRLSPGLQHNVSNTITVRSDEWEAVADYIWEHRSMFTGVALLTDVGDKGYKQAPREEVVTLEDVTRWNSLQVQPVDYTQVREEDITGGVEHRGAAVACSGGRCELA